MAHRVIWAFAIMVAIAPAALADGTATASGHQNQAKNMALPNGFKTAQGFKAVDAVKGAKLSTEGASTAMVARDSVSPRLSLH